ncbi:RING/U-box superfamily protein [Striga asiatica]|uniref:RING-type E3 ubiquitin transferase n=1 Tax=Striga asiatica TaxID=4170 RepID=A0A5A7RHD8_STRAF|nr:RING/U-box superfamily protein [Striga asiatica]
MQRERGAFNSFPEPIDLNQGSVPNSTTSMDHRSSSWDNMLSPVENRLSNYMLGSTTDLNVTCTNATSDTCHNFSGWDRGESSSSTHDRADSKTSPGWSNLFDSCPLPDPTSDNWSFRPSSSSRPAASMQNYNSAPVGLNLNSNDGYERETHRFYKSDCSEIDRTPTFYASSSNLGALMGGGSSASVDNDEASGPLGPPFGSWGSSCKRKALEGTSSGSSSSNGQNPFPDNYPSRGNLSIISSAPLDLPSPANNNQEQVNNNNNPSTGFFSSSSGGLTESPARNFASRSNLALREPILFDNSRITSSRNNLSAYSPESRSPVTITMSPNAPLSPNESTRGGAHPYPVWNGPSGSRARAREEISVRTYRRTNNNNNNVEYPRNASASQDQVDWSFVPGNSLSSRNHSLGLRACQGSGGNRASSSAYVAPHPSPPSQNHQRWPETATWAPYHRGESESSGIRRGHFVPHLGSHSDEAGPSSSIRSRNQLDQRSTGFLMDVTGDDVSGWRSIAAVESRHRLIRQVLSAMRRGVHLQAEDYMLADPFISGFAELHDRHRDMRLDVDNMSYEELLALEERIGNVSTGLTEERITGTMKQRKFNSIGVLSNLEPCCVCQEDYITGDDIGILDCGHEFHSGCIKQWLTVKNLCPICKMTGLGI